jgi:hypothetical protein
MRAFKIEKMLLTSVSAVLLVGTFACILPVSGFFIFYQLRINKKVSELKKYFHVSTLRMVFETPASLDLRMVNIV